MDNNYVKSIILYIFFGVCTTLVNIIVYLLFSSFLNCSVTISTIFAWIIAVLFAYLTNRTWVFNSKKNGFSERINELYKFYLCRLMTGIIDLIGMYILVSRLNYTDVTIKLFLNIIIIIINYIASKLIVFNNER